MRAPSQPEDTIEKALAALAAKHDRERTFPEEQRERSRRLSVGLKPKLDELLKAHEDASTGAGVKFSVVAKNGPNGQADGTNVKMTAATTINNPSINVYSPLTFVLSKSGAIIVSTTPANPTVTKELMTGTMSEVENRLSQLVCDYIRLVLIG